MEGYLVTIASTYSKVLEIVRASSGIQTAASTLPDALNNDADLPLAIVKVGGAEWNEHALGLYRQQRNYAITVYVKAVAEGIRDEGYQKCLPILNALGNTLVQNQDLDGTVDHIGEQGEFTDNGVEVLEHAGCDYHGFRVNLMVIEKTTG